MENRFVLKEEIRNRCRIIPLDEKEEKKFTPISMELYFYLSEVESIDFCLYFRVEKEMVEFIKPKELSHHLLNTLWQAALVKDVNIDVCILKSDLPKFELLIDKVRNKKIKAVLEKDKTLDPRVIDIYSSLSGASQMILRGGITSAVASRAKAAAANLMQSQLDNHVALGTISRMINCDSTLYDHSAAVAMFASIIGSLLKNQVPRKECEIIAQCGLYHDTGKSCVPNDILNKPGKFTPEEFEIMKTHAEHGYKELSDAILKGAPIHPVVATVAHEHHEKFRGGGYPCGKIGRKENDPEKGIHLYARIVSIADVYSALLMKRVYKDAMSAEEAIKLMQSAAERDFDPDLFKIFYDSIFQTEKIFKNREWDNKKQQIKIIGNKDSFADALKELKQKKG